MLRGFSFGTGEDFLAVFCGQVVFGFHEEDTVGEQGGTWRTA
jgi:hypothetical protein